MLKVRQSNNLYTEETVMEPMQGGLNEYHSGYLSRDFTKKQVNNKRQILIQYPNKISIPQKSQQDSYPVMMKDQDTSYINIIQYDNIHPIELPLIHQQSNLKNTRKNLPLSINQMTSRASQSNLFKSQVKTNSNKQKIIIKNQFGVSNQKQKSFGLLERYILVRRSQYINGRQDLNNINKKSTIQLIKNIEQIGKREREFYQLYQI